jgi:hypothetical protein
MRQLWPPQAKIVLGAHLPGYGPGKYGFLDPNILTSSMIAQIWLQKIIFLNFWQTSFGKVRKILQQELN